MDWELAGKIIWVIFVVCWGAIRWVPNKRSRRTDISTTVRTVRERLSIAISTTGIGVLPGIWVFTGFPKSLDFEPIPIFIVIGGFVCLFALYLFKATHKALGAMWSFSLDLRSEHKLVTEGIYKKVRHPMYSAFWLWAIGQSLVLSNWAAAFSAFVGFGTLYFLRVGQEEKMMLKEFGAEYEEYSQRTGRIFPRLK